MTAPFDYPLATHTRRHGPQGYVDYESYRPWLRDEFAFRCVYCLFREMWGTGQGTHAIDHLLAVAIRPDLALDYDNLVTACVSCNLGKGSLQTPDPLTCLIASDVQMSEKGEIRAETPEARKLIDLLGLNRSRWREFRELWIRIVQMAKRHDPALWRRIMAYPSDLPDVSRLRPPKGNTRPEGVAQSYFARRERGELQETY